MIVIKVLEDRYNGKKDSYKNMDKGWVKHAEERVSEDGYTINCEGTEEDSGRGLFSDKEKWSEKDKELYAVVVQM